jgi:ABC-2 type transport system ATP-binding protein
MQGPSEAVALRLEAVTKRYGDHTAVEDLSFVVPHGLVYGVLGPNGAGKTTTLRMINDILAPDEGRILVLDRLRPGREAAEHIGYLPEERGLYPKMKVTEIVSFFGQLRGLSARTSRRRAEDWLDRLGIGDWKGNRVQDLSKGMQQKVQFAAALLHEPEILILDEPWSGLDPINADVLREIVLEQKQAGRTILFSTHLMEQAEQICDRVCIIARGRRVVEGTLEDIKRQAAGDRLVALAFADDAERSRAEAGVLADTALVANRRARRGYLEVEIAEGLEHGALLAALTGAGLALRRFEVIEPTLHQIFVDRVGADEGGRVGAARKSGVTRG